MNTLDTLLLGACGIALCVAALGFGYGWRVKNHSDRETARRDRTLARRDREIVRLRRRCRKSRRNAADWAFFSCLLIQDGAQRQRTLEAMHQDLKAEAEARASEGEALQFHERRANRYLQLIQGLRVALAREKSLRERDKLVLEFLGKIAPLVKGFLPAP
jgi:hypothetical protein